MIFHAFTAAVFLMVPTPLSLAITEAAGTETVAATATSSDVARTTKVFRALGGREGIERIVDTFVAEIQDDPRIDGMAEEADAAAVRRQMTRHVCDVAGGTCRPAADVQTMVAAIPALTTKEFNAGIEALQAAMRAEGVSNWAQARVIAKLLPLHRDFVRDHPDG